MEQALSRSKQAARPLSRIKDPWSLEMRLTALRPLYRVLCLGLAQKPFHFKKMGLPAGHIGLMQNPNRTLLNDYRR